MVTLRICCFFDFLPFLPILLYTDENFNASAFDKQLHTLSTDFGTEFLQKNILMFVACGGDVKLIMFTSHVHLTT